MINLSRNYLVSDHAFSQAPRQLAKAIVREQPNAVSINVAPRKVRQSALAAMAEANDLGAPGKVHFSSLASRKIAQANVAPTRGLSLSAIAVRSVGSMWGRIQEAERSRSILQNVT